MDYDDLVKYLLDIREEEAADAITQLRAERDALKDELRRTCEHLGLDQLLAERDALRARVAELTDELQIECAARQTALAERDALAALLLEARRELHNDGTGYMQTLLARIDALAAERDTYAEDNRRHTEATNCMMDDLVTLRKRYERLSTASRQAYALAITEINIREAETVSLKADLAAARERVAELEKGCDTLTAAAMASYKRAERAEADLAATRADAERYRKLRSSAYKIYLFHNGEHYTVELPSPGYFPPSEFDAAIDRALAGKDAP